MSRIYFLTIITIVQKMNHSVQRNQRFVKVDVYKYIICNGISHKGTHVKNLCNSRLQTSASYYYKNDKNKYSI